MKKKKKLTTFGLEMHPHDFLGKKKCCEDNPVLNYRWNTRVIFMQMAGQERASLSRLDII